MKTFLKTFCAWLVLPILLASGCAQTTDNDDIQNQTGGLSTSQIATIASQIESILNSIKALEGVDGELRNLISNLEQDLQQEMGDVDALSAAINSLRNEDDSLSQRIYDLKQYCSLQDNNVKSWVSVTFTTLEQHGAVLAEISSIKIRLSELTQAIADMGVSLSNKISEAESRLTAAIASSESSVKGWVSEQLSGYYTIAQVEAKLKAQKDSCIVRDETLSTEISSLWQNLETAKTELKAAYQAAIISAINDFNGIISGKIAADIKVATDSLQEQLDAISARLDRLEARIASLEASVAKIIGMVQSVVVVPDYSDGSVLLTQTAENVLRFEVHPLTAAAAIAETGTSILSLDYVETITRSSENLINLPISNVSFTGKTLLVTVDGTGLPDAVLSGPSSANARLKISDGTITKSSEYFPIYNNVNTNDSSSIAITGECSDINTYSAVLYGWCNQEGVEGASVKYGIEYSSTDLTTNAGTVMADEKDSSNKYHCYVDNLSSNTLYYYRAFVLYNGIRLYGEVKSFRTQVVSATVTTLAANAISTYNFSLNGSLVVNNAEPLNTSVWFLYSNTANSLEKLLSSGAYADAILNEDGSFQSVLRTIRDTTYYVAVAMVYDTIIYGSVMELLPVSGSFPCEIDGEFSEWQENGIACAVVEPEYASPGLIVLKASGDPDNLYLYFEYELPTEYEYSVSVQVYINSDGNAKTGFDIWMWENSGVEYLLESEGGFLINGQKIIDMKDISLYKCLGPDNVDPWSTGSRGWGTQEITGFCSIKGVIKNGTACVEMAVQRSAFENYDVGTIGVGVAMFNSAWSMTGCLPQGPSIGVANLLEVSLP